MPACRNNNKNISYAHIVRDESLNKRRLKDNRIAYKTVDWYYYDCTALMHRRPIKQSFIQSIMLTKLKSRISTMIESKQENEIS